METLSRLLGPPNVEQLSARGNVDGLIKALSWNHDSQVRAHAAMKLGEMRDPQTIHPLMTVLLDKDANVRRVGVEALDQMQVERLIEAAAGIFSAKPAEKPKPKIGEKHYYLSEKEIARNEHIFRLACATVQYLGGTAAPEVLEFLKRSYTPKHEIKDESGYQLMYSGDPDYYKFVKRFVMYTRYPALAALGLDLSKRVPSMDTQPNQVDQNTSEVNPNHCRLQEAMARLEHEIDIREKLPISASILLSRPRH